MLHNFLGTLDIRSIFLFFCIVSTFLFFLIKSSRTNELRQHPLSPLLGRLFLMNFFTGLLSEDHIAVVAEVAAGNNLVIIARGGSAHGGVGGNN
jgi:hypothetical protein